MHLWALQPFRSGFPNDAHTQFLNSAYRYYALCHNSHLKFDVWIIL